VTIKVIRTATGIPGQKENQREMEVNNWHKELTYDNWVPITVTGARPPARYKVYFSLSFSFSYFIRGWKNTITKLKRRHTCNS
jgi:hypothetical protein